DCGGPTCPKCMLMQQCGVNGDCASGVGKMGKGQSYFGGADSFGNSDTNPPALRSMAVDPGGEGGPPAGVLGTVDFGTGPVSAPSMSPDSVVLLLGPAGNTVLTTQKPAIQFARVAVDGNGNTIIAGQYFGTLNFGCGPITSTSYDGFIAKISES